MLDHEVVLKHYARKSIQEEIVKVSKDREVSVMYGKDVFGKRPDVLVYPQDVFDLALAGATSFHISEERWSNPLNLVTGVTRRELDELRIGWDCVLDVDSPFLEYSKVSAFLITEALKFYGIRNFGVKFSGKKGFHVIFPFESFPKSVGGKDTKLLFPEGPRMIAACLNHIIHDQLAERILSMNSVEEIAKATQRDVKELLKNGKFNPFSIVEIDTILIASRHLFRSPYSLNEKSGLVSIPIEQSDILKFKVGAARPERVNTDVPFIPERVENEAQHLFDMAYKEFLKQEGRSSILVGGREYTREGSGQKHGFMEVDRVFVKPEFFPPCIQHLLRGVESDGRKRAVFVLVNFLKSLKYSMDEIDEMLREWNAKNYEPLREGYVKSQVSWHKRQKTAILPPNCDNQAYYVGMGVCHPDALCRRIKNPVNYVMVKMRSEREGQQKNNQKRKRVRTSRRKE